MAGLDLNALKEKAAGLLNGFTRGQKAMLLVAIVAAVVGAMTFMRWAAEPSWTPLYSGLPSEEAASVTQELDAMGVDYQLEGDTILVQRDAVYQARLDLSAKGLPEDGAPGYDLLDDASITTSEFKQQVDYQRALEGELVRTITALDSVDDASVHLVIPEDDLFTDDPVRPTASVLVHTAPDATLPAGQVQAIVHLVASSVEGLQATDITVADQTGRMLAAPGEDGLSAAVSDARSTQTAGFESDLSKSIEDLLTPMTGVGRSRVQVQADLDFDDRETTSETFTEPDTAPVVDETTTEETYTGQGTGVGGVLGPDTTPVEGGQGTDYTKTQASRSFAVGKVTEKVDSAPGAVEKLSVAVLVDERAGADLAEVQSLVAAAAGIDPERGDLIQVTETKFDASALPVAIDADAGGEAEPNPLLSAARVAGIVGLIGLVLLLSYRSARRSSVARYPLAIPLDPMALAAGNPVRVLTDDEDEIDLDHLDALEAGPEEPDEEDRHLVVQSQIGDLIDRQPDEVAQVLRGWLADRRG